MIRLENISKIYKVGKEDFYALRDVTLTIEKGEIVAIRGASGCGKTTLLNVIGCLDRASRGSYFFEGEDVSRLSDGKSAVIRNEKIGFVLQDFALINTQTVLYNVMLPLLFSKMPYSKIKKRALAVLEQVGIADQAKKKANRLSGGQRQRVAIARALVNSSSLLLADEPTGQLDSKTGESIMTLLRELNESGITVVMVTHDDKVASIAHRQITLSDGSIKS